MRREPLRLKDAVAKYQEIEKDGTKDELKGAQAIMAIFTEKPTYGIAEVPKVAPPSTIEKKAKKTKANKDKKAERPETVSDVVADVQDPLDAVDNEPEAHPDMDNDQS
jgi:hypothetical protein